MQSSMGHSAYVKAWRPWRSCSRRAIRNMGDQFFPGREQWGSHQPVGLTSKRTHRSDSECRIATTARLLIGSAVVALSAGLQAARAQAPDAATAVYSWIAANSLEGGAFRNCGDPPYGNYKVEIRDQVLRGVPEKGETQWERSVTVSLKSLKADGSGRVTRLDRLGRRQHWDFDAGAGARKIYIRGEFSECRYLWTPK